MNIKISKAIVIEKPRHAAFRDIALTEVTPDSIICKTRMSAISSGTDMKTWRGEQHPENLYYPCVPGYENVGEVVWVGTDADRSFKAGDRVMINECRQFGNVCGAWGGNSGYVIKNKITASAPFDALAKIPDNVSDRDAVLAYLACVSLKGIYRLSLSPEETVAVIGAGMIGISAVQILKILCPGIKVVCIERNAFRRSIAAKYADAVFSSEEGVEKLREYTGGKMADKLIECSGNAAVVGTLHKYIKDGGWDKDDEPAHIHLQGDYPDRIIMDSYHRWFTKNCTITMTCALKRGCKEHILTWMSEGKFDTSGIPVEIHPAEKCAEMYKYVDSKGSDVFKVLFDWKGAL
jgi:2-desacetyl-2-hydroxyethyl bacteriochlorophyllide A dehydrogenase